MSISLCHPLGLSKVVGHQNNPSKPLNTIFEANRKDSGILGATRSPVGQMAVSRWLTAGLTAVPLLKYSILCF